MFVSCSGGAIEWISWWLIWSTGWGSKAGRTDRLGHWLGSIKGQSYWLGSLLSGTAASKNIVGQVPSACYYKLNFPPLLFDSPWLSSAGSPSIIPIKSNGSELPRKCSTMLEKLAVQLGPFFPLEKQ